MASRTSALFSRLSQQGLLVMALFVKRSALSLGAIGVVFMFIACGQETKLSGDKGKLVYQNFIVKSGDVEAIGELTGELASQELHLELKLVNNGVRELHVSDVVVSTPEGVRSAPLNMSAVGIRIPAESDTILNLIYKPVNDLPLYQLTGIRGFFRPGYQVTVTYEFGDQQRKSFDVTLQMPEGQYTQYENDNKAEVSAYVFDAGDDFNERQSRYLGEVIRDRTPFVYVSEQEIMVSGLNVRLKGYQLDDSLKVNLTFINHADFSVTVDTANLFLYGNNLRSGDMSLRNDNGQASDPVLLKEGDRMSIALRERLISVDSDEYLISFRKSILFSNGRPVFVKDIKLIQKNINF